MLAGDCHVDGVHRVDHVCAIFADSALSNVCDSPIVYKITGFLPIPIGSYWFIGCTEREVYGDHKNRHYLGVTSLRFLARAT